MTLLRPLVEKLLHGVTGVGTTGTRGKFEHFVPVERVREPHWRNWLLLEWR